MKQLINSITILTILIVSGWIAYIGSGFLTTNPISRVIISALIFILSYAFILCFLLILLWLVLETVRKINDNVK